MSKTQCIALKKKSYFFHAENFQSWLFRTKAKNLPCYIGTVMASSFQTLEVIFAWFYFMRVCNNEKLTNRN